MLPAYFALLFFSPDLTADLLRKIILSGRVCELAVNPSDRVSPRPEIAPGAPPVLSFRLFEGQLRNRFQNSDLVLDDAGH